MFNRMMIFLLVLIMTLPVIAQEDNSFPVVEKCFTESAGLRVRDGLVFQTVDETRPTLGGEVLDVWIVRGGQSEYLFRHTDSRAGFITDGERMMMISWGGGVPMAYMLGALDEHPYPLFAPLAEWFTPQWLTSGRVAFNVMGTLDESLEIITLNIDHLPDEVPTAHDLGGWIHAIYEFKDAETVYSSGMVQFGAVISPNEQLVLASRSNADGMSRTIELMDLEDREISWQTDDADIGQVLWHPDAMSFVYLKNVADDRLPRQNELVWVDISGQILLTTTFNSGEEPHHLEPLAWSPDGRYIVLTVNTSAEQSRLYMLDTVEGTVINTCETVTLNTVLWSPDSGQFIYHALNGWQVADYNTFETASLSDVMGDGYHVPLVWMK